MSSPLPTRLPRVLAIPRSFLFLGTLCLLGLTVGAHPVHSQVKSAPATSEAAPASLSSLAQVSEAEKTVASSLVSLDASVTSSAVAAAAVTPDFEQGFSAGSLATNGSARVVGSALRLTDGKQFEAASAFFPRALSLKAFTTEFTFRLTNPDADGLTLTIQAEGRKAIGDAGGSLGAIGIAKSVSVAFDLFNNSGEGDSATYLLQDGQPPTTPTDLRKQEIDLHSGHVLRARVTSLGEFLLVIVTDTETGARALQAYRVDLSTALQSETGFFGFTAGTGGSAATQDILTWTYDALPQLPSLLNPALLVRNGSAQLSKGVLRLTDGKQYEAGSAYVVQPVDVSAFLTDFTFRLTNPDADGFTFALQRQGPRAVGDIGGSLGFAGIRKSFAVAFDVYNNSGEGNNSIYLYKNVKPTVPFDLKSSGLDLHSGHIFEARILYVEKILLVTLTDTSTGARAIRLYPGVDLEQILGGTDAYIGFTGGTGGLAATQEILSWTFLAPPQ